MSGCNFFEHDLQDLEERNLISKKQRAVFEQAASEIGKFYRKFMEGQKARKKRILELTLEKYDIEQELGELLKLEKEREITVI